MPDRECPRPPADEQELRLALVLNGGVSLAVWMGGVVHEINRLVQREENPRSDAYAKLLELTATLPRVDVISGSSAGGLNGALLAMALVHRQDLGPVRELWTKRAGFGELLRHPFDRKLPSLLDGDGYFLEQLRGAFRSLRRGDPRPASEVPIDLTLTGTLLRGRGEKLWDDFGAVISDRTHGARFHFVRGAGAAEDPFLDAGIVDALALAARSTASYPGAFEASFCPGTPETARATGRPDMSRYTGLKEDRFVVDGGVLDNKPFQPALEAIFKQRSARDVRRVLAYVVPSEEEPDGGAPDESAEEPPTLGRVVTASLTELPRVESVTEELKQLRERNLRVLQRCKARVDLTTTLDPKQVDAIAAILFPVYRRRRIDASMSYVVSEISGVLAERDGRGLGYRGRREWLVRMLRKSTLPWIPSGDVTTAMTVNASETVWGWGTRPAEQAKNVVLDALRWAQRLARLAHVKEAELDDLWKGVLDAQEDIAAIRAVDRKHWRQSAEGLGTTIGRGTGDRSSGDLEAAMAGWTSAALAGWSEAHVTLPRHRQRGKLSFAAAAALVAREVAAVLLELNGVLAPILAAAEGLSGVEEEACELGKHLRYFVRAESDGVQEVLGRLLQLEVITRATCDQEDEHEQVVELAQFSAEGGSPLGGPQEAKGKLAGRQLANFGAFYKRSWRANDWMFGRLDAAARIVKVVLNPERLRIVWRGRDGAARCVLEKLEAFAWEGLPRDVRDTPLAHGWRRGDAEAELRYLDDPALPIPEFLPACEDLVVRRLHYDIIRDELDAVYTECVQDQAAGALRTGSGGPAFIATFLAKLPDGRRASGAELETIIELFRACTVGGERLAAEVGTDLFTAVTSRSLAVAIGMGERQSSGLGPVRPLLKLMRAPVLGAYLAARALVLRSRPASTVLLLAAGFSATVLGGRTAGWWTPGSTVLGAAITIAVALFVAVALWRWKVAAVVGAVATLIRGAFLLWTGRFGWPSWRLETWRALAAGLLAMLALALFPWPSRFIVAAERRWKAARRWLRSRGTSSGCRCP
jgi:patatin-related protein